MSRREILQELLRELNSTTCRCGASKARKNTFCRGDYFRLYAGIGNGYEEAYDDAVKFLGLPERMVSVALPSGGTATVSGPGANDPQLISALDEMAQCARRAVSARHSSTTGGEQ